MELPTIPNSAPDIIITRSITSMRDIETGHIDKRIEKFWIGIIVLELKVNSPIPENKEEKSGVEYKIAM